MTFGREIALWILTGAALAVILVLILTGHPVPTQLWVLLSALVAGGLGLAVPSGATGTVALPAELVSLPGEVRGAIGLVAADVEHALAGFRSSSSTSVPAPAPAPVAAPLAVVPTIVPTVVQ